MNCPITILFGTLDTFITDIFAVFGPQPGTRSQQPFETYLHHIPASVVVLKLNYSVESPWRQLNWLTPICTLWLLRLLLLLAKVIWVLLEQNQLSCPPCCLINNTKALTVAVLTQLPLKIVQVVQSHRLKFTPVTSERKASKTRQASGRGKIVVYNARNQDDANIDVAMPSAWKWLYNSGTCSCKHMHTMFWRPFSR